MIHLCFIQNQKTTAEERTALYAEWIEHCLDVHASELARERSPTGKPSFVHVPTGTRYFFSGSHSGDALLFGVSKNQDFAVDLEIPNPRRMMDSVLKRFFSEEEIAFVDSASDRLRAFLFLWTRREALVKTTGEGIAAITKKTSVLQAIARLENEEYYLFTPLNEDTLKIADPKDYIAALSVHRAPSNERPNYTLETYADLDGYRKRTKFSRFPLA